MVLYFNSIKHGGKSPKRDEQEKNMYIYGNPEMNMSD